MLREGGCGAPGRPEVRNTGRGAGGGASRRGWVRRAPPEGNGGQRQQEREPEPVRTGQTNQKWESLVHSLGHLSTAVRGHRRE